MIRDATLDDAASIRDIYDYYIENTTVSFEEESVSREEMEARIAAKIQADMPWLVWEQDGEIQGYAYAGRWKERSAYRSCAESTVYVKNGCRRQGIGSNLYNSLLEKLREKGFHVVMAVISVPNEPSARLHERSGFEKMACFREVGFKFDRWLDVEYWELLL